MKKFLTFILTLTLNTFNIFGQNESELNCFTILVGISASTDGSVFIAQNEDDLNDHNFVDLHKVPRIKHQAGEKQIFLFNADSIDEAKETFAYFWITGSKYVEEQYLNEWGVTITSNSSRSNVQTIKNGKINYKGHLAVAETGKLLSKDKKLHALE